MCTCARPRDVCTCQHVRKHTQNTTPNSHTAAKEGLRKPVRSVRGDRGRHTQSPLPAHHTSPGASPPTYVSTPIHPHTAPPAGSGAWCWVLGAPKAGAAGSFAAGAGAGWGVSPPPPPASRPCTRRGGACEHGHVCVRARVHAFARAQASGRCAGMLACTRGCPGKGKRSEIKPKWSDPQEVTDIHKRVSSASASSWWGVHLV